MVKPGYKLTEIGEIPEDWELGILKDAFFHLEAGVSVQSDESTSSNFYVLKTSAVRDGIVNLKEAKAVIPSDYNRLKCPIKQGTLLISRMNTPDMVGDCGYSFINAPNIFLPDRLWQIEPLSHSEYDFRWINYLLNTDKYKTIIRATATGTSNSMKNIAKDRLLNITIPKPTYLEQEHIAEALSDVDALIASLEKLIAKKKAIKQGAMQRLLTGKTRLPGFAGKLKQTEFGEIPEDWTTTRLGELCSITTGKKDVNEGNPNGIYPFFTCSRNLSYNDNYSFDCEAILIAGNGEVGNLHYYNGKFEAYQRTYVISRFEVNAYYVLYFLEYKLKDELGIGKIGSSIPYIKRENLHDFILFLPESKEQQSIVSALFDINNEIEQLEQKLTKASQLKQGMMQQLLTGKIRLL